MIYFSADFLQFFKELAANNHKEWFDENRKRYEKEVKEPFKKLVGDVILEMRKEEPELLVEPKDCIFRINRDIRFSKDKTPYKTNVSAAISKGGRKSMDEPGLYFELGPERFGIYGGIYMPDSKLLKNIRGYIAANVNAFRKAYTQKDFVDHYGELHGEKNKRIDKEFREAGEHEPLLYNKQFYYFAELDPAKIEDDGLVELLMQYYRAAAPLKEFLRQACV
jgi:uncharacterized protein (TIGR02453 family)